jgi:Thrombospondin type 3 repeat/RTX calcium-binding nonapeptide repeat (4 copies)
VRRLCVATLLIALALPASAAGHSLVRSGGGVVSYLSADATSLNTLQARQDGGRVEFRDATVDSGMDPGSCTPGEVSADGFIVQTSCSLDGVSRVRIDLGDREDSATVTLALPVSLLGGTGADTLHSGAGADEVVGGEGDDALAGGAGDDIMSGDQGADGIDGGEGADEIRARDGEADTVACGPGADSVDADGVDVVAADCEQVTRTATAAPGPTADDGKPPVVDAGAPTVQRVGRARVVRVYATTSEPGTLGASGSLEASGLALPIKRVPRARIAVAGGGAELAYRLTGRHWRLARRALARGKRVVVRLGVVATDQTGKSALRKAPAVRLVRERKARASVALHPEPNDVDGDEVRNEVDNCPTVRNGSQVNTDGDTLGDACDDDDDADAVPDASDNCRIVVNPDQTDTDGDGHGDACPPKHSDSDGIIDDDDNCDFVDNPDQSDLDGDDKGDACDLDRDGDRFDDRYDNCPTVYNLEPTDIDGDGFVNDQLDRDGDGIGTACDPDEPVIGGAPPPGGGGASGSAPDRTSPRLALRVARRHRMAAIRGGLVVRLNCSEACAATAELAVKPRAARRLRLGRTTIVAGGSARLGGSGTTYAFVRFAKRARRALMRAGGARATLTAIAVDPSGNRRALTRQITLRR